MKKMILSLGLALATQTMAMGPEVKVICTDANSTKYDLSIVPSTGETTVVFGTKTLVGRTAMQNGTYEMRATDGTRFSWANHPQCFRMKAAVSMQVQMKSSNLYEGLVYTAPSIEFKPGFDYSNCSIPMFLWNPQFTVSCQKQNAQPLDPTQEQEDIALGEAMKELALYLGTRFWAGGPPQIAGQASVVSKSKTEVLGEEYDQYIFSVPTSHVTFGAGSIEMTVLMLDNKAVKVSFGN